VHTEGVEAGYPQYLYKGKSLFFADQLASYPEICIFFVTGKFIFNKDFHAHISKMECKL
jgi:hypothetical protein